MKSLMLPIKNKIYRVAFLSLFLYAIFGLTSSVTAQSFDQITNDQWEEDIDFLSEQLLKTVPGIEERVSKEVLEAEMEALKSSLPNLNGVQTALALQKVLGLVKEDGCDIYPFQEVLGSKILPLKTYLFADGLYICDASEEYSNIIGQKIETINKVPVANVLKAIMAFSPADNTYFQAYLFPFYWQIDTWFASAMNAPITEELTLGFTSGKEAVVAYEEVSEYIQLDRQLTSHRQLSSSSIRHENENYWMEYMEEEQTLFVQFLTISDNKGGLSIKQFTEEVETAIKTLEIARLVIDNRYGGGGNGFKLKPFIDMIKESEALNHRGKLFVLTSRATRGTVMELTSILELNTKAVFIGEPTGEGPNLVGDTRIVELPNSKLRVSLTNKFWPTSWEKDNRLVIHPEVEVAYRFEDYQEKIDPWLIAVQEYEPVSEITEKAQIKSLSPLKGKYSIEGESVEIFEENGQLFVALKRKMKSFFELKTQLYPMEEGVLVTDIRDVKLLYKLDLNGKPELLGISWKGVDLRINS
ncbi:MAG: hypothetical protein ACRBG0_12625 [Lewinella sp.]|jgi:hypothetical protein|uniref:hypothetical protein n=1 Tax=Lewinella sp. TaxID=2004506 RepID=UPI003D6A30F7